MKVHFLDLGRIEYDLGWALLGAGVSTPSDPNPTSPRRNVAVIATLIDHPSAGPVLFDTGIAPAYQELWPAQIQQAFAVTRFEDENRLEGALGAAGYALHDVRAVVLSHLHLDHAGGLEAFRGTNVPIYVHADELRNAFYAVATGEDLGAYLP
ncbi:MAG: MBL fold metallo-hydrolase, partial [Candidatus Dormibacteraeota bacterium]|nr:MBL fold metallo-hydrolase [Candidatus Dormibacteraeota bacterium]